MTIAAMVSAGSAIFYRPKDKAIYADNAHKNFHMGNPGDHIAQLNVFNGWVETAYSAQWCFENFVQVRDASTARCWCLLDGACPSLSERFACRDAGVWGWLASGHSGVLCIKWLQAQGSLSARPEIWNPTRSVALRIVVGSGVWSQLLRNLRHCKQHPASRGCCAKLWLWAEEATITLPLASSGGIVCCFTWATPNHGALQAIQQNRSAAW